jgi:hypothetical protein
MVMADPAGTFADDARAQDRTGGAGGSLWRYGAAWLAGAGMVYWTAPQIPVWGEGGARALLSVLTGGAAVMAALVLGLPLRFRSWGREWNRFGLLAGLAVPTALVVHVWNRELAEWLAGVEIEQIRSGEDFAQMLYLSGWFAVVFLVVNFPRRARLGLGFAETFSPAKRRWLRRAGLLAAVTTMACWLVPAPLAGYWHTPFSDCLCNSKNLLVFEDGRVFQWASGHGVAKEPAGTYRRHGWWVTWDRGRDGEQVELRPGWIFMELRSPASASPFPERISRGYREWRLDYIREVLATTAVPLLSGDEGAHR